MQTALHGEDCTELSASALNCLPCTVFLPSKLALIKEFLFQPIGLKLSPSNWSCAAISPSTSSLANQESPLWSNPTMDLESLFAGGQPNQGPEQVPLSIKAISPLDLGAHFPFPLRTDYCVSLAELTHWSCLPRAEWSRPTQ